MRDAPPAICKIYLTGERASQLLSELTYPWGDCFVRCESSSRCQKLCNLQAALLASRAALACYRATYFVDLKLKPCFARCRA